MVSNLLRSKKSKIPCKFWNYGAPTLGLDAGLSLGVGRNRAGRERAGIGLGLRVLPLGAAGACQALKRILATLAFIGSGHRSEEFRSPYLKTRGLETALSLSVSERLSTWRTTRISPVGCLSWAAWASSSATREKIIMPSSFKSGLGSDPPYVTWHPCVNAGSPSRKALLCII